MTTYFWRQTNHYNPNKKRDVEKFLKDYTCVDKFFVNFRKDGGYNNPAPLSEENVKKGVELFLYYLKNNCPTYKKDRVLYQDIFKHVDKNLATRVVRKNKTIWDIVEENTPRNSFCFKNRDFNIYNKKGQTPLMVAAQHHSDYAIAKMFDAIVNVQMKDKDGKTAYDYIPQPTNSDEKRKSDRTYATMRILELKQIVRAKANIMRISYDLKTDTLKIRIKRVPCEKFKFPKNTICTWKKTGDKHPIFNTIKDHNYALFYKLLPNIDINMTDQGGISLLWWAMYKKDYNIVEKLLKSGIDREILDGNEHHFPLKYAAIKDNTRLIDLLIKYGADIDRKDRFGMTSIMSAANRCRLKSVEALLDRDANISIVSYKRTVIDYLQKCKKIEKFEKINRRLSKNKL